jgi:hypothetical protein
MKLAIFFLAGGLLTGSVVVAAEEAEPAVEPSAGQAPVEQAPADSAQPAMTQKDIDAALLEAARKEAEVGRQRDAGADGVDYRPWSPPPRPAAPSKASAHRPGSQFHPVSVTGSASQAYAAQWGIDSLKVAYTSSGNLLRFTYRVVDPGRAAPLADKKLTPSLYSPKHRAVLSVPVMEKVGPLRQAMEQKSGMEYWMAFSNRGALVKPGERVNITIGSFHADGLRVE